jgi:FAD/FMN-containing dehydrogenase
MAAVKNPSSVRVVQLENTALEQFATGLRGQLIKPEDPEYAEARKLYNAMIDKHPALIVRCADVADVIACVNFARDQGLLLAIRGGGHNGPGLGSCDGGLVIDLSRMRGIRIDPNARTAWVEGGCTWGDVDHATHAFGLATPSGIIGTTGVGGLTLGGGIGYLNRSYGLTIDNLLAVEMVLADGSFVSANANEHPDLYWAVRGGGGNFGVVTAFQYRLHPVDNVVAGPVFWSMDQAADVMRWYRDFLPSAPDGLSGWIGFLTVPPVDMFPPELQLKKVCGIVWCYTGPMDKADEVFAPIRTFGPPILDGTQPMPYPAIQGAFNALYPPGDQWYWKADFFTEISDEAITRHIKHAQELPTPQSTMHLYPVLGAVHNVKSDETAWAFRHASYAEVIVGVDPDPANNDRMIKWARDYWEDLHPLSAGGAYVNMMMEEGHDRVKNAYGENYERLAAIKQTYDPENLFRVNQNIQPAH